MTEKNKELLADLTRSGIPVVVALMLMGAIGTGCFAVGKTVTAYDRQQSDVAALAVEVRALQEVIKPVVLEARWTRNDQVLFCWEAEHMNPPWRCPAVKSGEARPPSHVEYTRQ